MKRTENDNINKKGGITMTKPEEGIDIDAIWAKLKDNVRIQDINSKLDRKSPLSIDETIMLQTLVFNEYRKMTDSTSKTIIFWTRGLVIATGILALAAIVTVLCRL